MKRPFFTTKEAADLISMTPAYVRGEIREGRLDAEVIERPVSRGRQRSKPLIRIYPEQLREYLRKYWPRVSFDQQPAA